MIRLVIIVNTTSLLKVVSTQHPHFEFEHGSRVFPDTTDGVWAGTCVGVGSACVTCRLEGTDCLCGTCGSVAEAACTTFRACWGICTTWDSCLGCTSWTCCTTAGCPGLCRISRLFPACRWRQKSLYKLLDDSHFCVWSDKEIGHREWWFSGRIISLDRTPHQILDLDRWQSGCVGASAWSCNIFKAVWYQAKHWTRPATKSDH